MIFVTLGTLHYPFNRLAQIVNQMSPTCSHKIIVQTGHTTTFLPNKNITLVPFLSSVQIKSYMKRSNLVLTHGGEGTLLDVLEHSVYMPIIFPRSQKYREHVDNYQSEIAAYAKKKNWAWVGNSPLQITRLIKNHLNTHPKLTVNRQSLRQNNYLIDYLTRKITQNP